jgi:hypothetical protein
MTQDIHYNHILTVLEHWVNNFADAPLMPNARHIYSMRNTDLSTELLWYKHNIDKLAVTEDDARIREYLKIDN